jgi:hypothetical protein
METKKQRSELPQKQSAQIVFGMLVRISTRVYLLRNLPQALRANDGKSASKYASASSDNVLTSFQLKITIVTLDAGAASSNKPMTTVTVAKIKQ